MSTVAPYQSTGDLAAELPPHLRDVATDEASLRRFLHGLPGVDPVGVEQRAAGLATRSIKKGAKLAAIDLAISMVDLTTLEGSDTPGKVRALAAKARRPDPEQPGHPARRGAVHLPGHGRPSRSTRWPAPASGSPRWQRLSPPDGPRWRCGWPTPRSPCRPAPPRSTW